MEAPTSTDIGVSKWPRSRCFSSQLVKRSVSLVHMVPKISYYHRDVGSLFQRHQIDGFVGSAGLESYLAIGDAARMHQASHGNATWCALAGSVSISSIRSSLSAD